MVLLCIQTAVSGNEMQHRKHVFLGYWLTIVFLLSFSTCLVCCQESGSCGNGVIEKPEECDNQSLGGKTCESLGYHGGNLGCRSDCLYDLSDCEVVNCGDLVITGDEECEDGNTEDWDGCNDCMISEFFVASSGWKSCPDIATSQSGDVLVAWKKAYPDGPDYAIHGQRLSSLGEKLGNEFVVEDSVDGWPVIGCPSLATRSDGSFFVAWAYAGEYKCGIFVRHFTADGTALGDAVRVDDGSECFLLIQQTRVEVAATGESGLVVVWSQQYPGPITPTDFSVSGRMLTGEGNPAGDVLLIEAVDGFDQIQPAVAMDNSGNFTVLWTSEVGEDDSDIKGRRFDSIGNPLGEVFTVNTTTEGPQARASISTTPGGGFVAVWEGDACIYGQIFDATGTPLGGEFRSDLAEGDRKYAPDVASVDNGDFIVAWTRYLDASQSQIEFRLYSPERTPAFPPMPAGLNERADGVATAVDEHGNYWVAWNIDELISMHGDIAIQRINSVGERRGVLPW